MISVGTYFWNNAHTLSIFYSKMNIEAYLFRVDIILKENYYLCCGLMAALVTTFVHCDCVYHFPLVLTNVITFKMLFCEGKEERTSVSSPKIPVVPNSN